jgi:selenium-binding protein 1
VPDRRPAHAGEESFMTTHRPLKSIVAACLTLAWMLGAGVAAADETCNSPYISKLIKGQEDFVYVWALGVEGVGDGSDKLVTIDVNPKSKSYGKVLGSVSVGTRGEAHHMGLTDDRRFIWAGGLAEPKKNVLLTSSFTGYQNYMRPLGELVKDGEAMKKFGSTMVAWDLKAMKPTTVFSVPGAPLEIRWSLKSGDNWAITAAALTSKLWLIKQDKGQWQAKEVGTIGDPAKIPLPVDISITRDGKGLWVNTFMDGTTRYFDLSNPEAPKQTYDKVTGKQVNMISQSWDGKRVYITSSLLANWDKTGADNEQFLRAFNWDGKELKPAFEVDFTKEQLGRAHHMKLGSAALKSP